MELTPLDEARALFLEAVRDRGGSGLVEEIVQARLCLGRISSREVLARRSSPRFRAAAMDGIAVRAEKTYGTTERQPRALKAKQDFAWINTGQPLPHEFDAVIMVEKLHQVDANHLEIRSSAYPWQNVRKVGEDIIATQLLFPQNHPIRPYDIGALISAGVF